MDTSNVVCPPARRSDGKKVDTWKVKLPGSGYHTVDVDIYMTRNDESVYMFHLEAPIGEKKHKISSTNPSELKDLLNELVAADIEKTWDKGLLITSSSFSNSHSSPDEPGSHEISMEWHVVCHKVINDFLCYLQDGELFTRSHYVGKKNRSSYDGDAPRIIPWTQHREDILRNLGKALHEASDKLEKLIKDDEIAKAIDDASVSSRLLIESVKEA